MKIRPVGAELIHTDRQTDGRTNMTKHFAILRACLKEPSGYYGNYIHITVSISVIAQS